jgi:hypothetical protein
MWASYVVGFVALCGTAFMAAFLCALLRESGGVFRQVLSPNHARRKTCQLLSSFRCDRMQEVRSNNKSSRNPQYREARKSTRQTLITLDVRFVPGWDWPLVKDKPRYLLREHRS